METVSALATHYTTKERRRKVIFERVEREGVSEHKQGCMCTYICVCVEGARSDRVSECVTV